MTQEITLLQQYCSTCKAVTYHIHVRHQNWVCLQCWPAFQDPPPPLGQEVGLDHLILFWKDALAERRLQMSPKLISYTQETIIALEVLNRINNPQPDTPISTN